MENLATDDPRAHAENVQAQLDELVAHLRQDGSKLKEPKAQALFETAAEVLTGLRAAFEHYQTKQESAWK
jgi:hypothetical protein